MSDDFINLKLSPSNLDRYVIRSLILGALDSALPRMHGKLLDIGCGKMPYRNYILANSKVKEYVGLDIENARKYAVEIKPDVRWDGIRMPFSDESFNWAFGTEVLEHCPNPTGVLKEAYRVLKPEGVFFFTVPFLWNLHEVPNDEYRFTPFSINRHLEEAGFNIVDIKATGGWHASMAQMLGLWVKRSPIKKSYKNILSWFSLPLIRYLLNKDKLYPKEFNEGQMITGLFGIAKKG